MSNENDDQNLSYLGVVLQVGFLLGLHLNDSVHVVFMGQLCSFPPHGNHTLRHTTHHAMYNDATSSLHRSALFLPAAWQSYPEDTQHTMHCTTMPHLVFIGQLCCLSLCHFIIIPCSVQSCHILSLQVNSFAFLPHGNYLLRKHNTNYNVRWFHIQTYGQALRNNPVSAPQNGCGMQDSGCRIQSCVAQTFTPSF